MTKTFLSSSYAIKMYYQADDYPTYLTEHRLRPLHQAMAATAARRLSYMRQQIIAINRWFGIQWAKQLFLRVSSSLYRWRK